MMPAPRIERSPSGSVAMLARCHGGTLGFVCTACGAFHKLAPGSLGSSVDDPASHSCRCGQWHELAAGCVTAV